jgi:hypothetical protein
MWHFLRGWHLELWQPLIGSLVAIVVAAVTVAITVRNANKQIAATRDQIGSNIRLERRRVVREGFAFCAMLEAAMGRVLADVAEAKARKPFLPQHVFTKTAFPELRAACVRQGGQMTATFLELENEIDSFVSKHKELSPDTPLAGQRVGLADGLLVQLAVIETKASHLRAEAAAQMKEATAILAATQPADH